MSENEISAESTGVPAEESAAPAAKVLKIHGKEFDISSPEGLLQAQAWGEAVSSLVGRQGQELGSLRKFVNEREPTKDEKELIAEAKRLASEGDVPNALDLMFNYAKETELQAKKTLEKERHNAETWEAYFESRPELVKTFGKSLVRKVSESAMDLTKEQDPFSSLDAFWKARSPEQTAKKPSTQDKPPVTLSGGSTRKLAPTAAPAGSKAPSFEQLLDEHRDRYFGKAS